MEDKKIIMYDSPEAATFRTNLSGWVTGGGLYYGKDEHIARWAGCTHIKCECGSIREKSYTICEECRRKKSNERYAALPFVEWDRDTPLTEWDGDKYFFSEEDIAEYCEEHEINPSELRLVVCTPNYLHPVYGDNWSDELPEEGELPPAIEKLVKELNEAIKKEGPVSWSQGKQRTTVEIEFEPTIIKD